MFDKEYLFRGSHAEKVIKLHHHLTITKANYLVGISMSTLWLLLLIPL